VPADGPHTIEPREYTMSKFDYFDSQSVVERVSAVDLPALLAQASTPDSHPIVRYAQTLKELRQQSAKIGNEQQQLAFGVTVRDALAKLGAELGLPEDHFSVDTSGDPLLVREGSGQHWILPTHFEGGAYFSAPHADHQFCLEAHQVPKIRIGRYARFGKGSGINAGGDITIGDGAWMSPGSLLLKQDHGAYGRPAVGARTVSMTSQPSIVLRDYAWVGRDALVGWNSDYIGLGGIVGTRSFINSWVGDYSIVGDHDRILQYLPYKAFLLGRYDLTVEEVIQISDWDRVNQDWRAVYAEDRARLLPQDRHREQDREAAEYLAALGGRGHRVLLVRPRSLGLLPALAEARLDVATGSQALTPYLLQWADDQRSRRIRIRSDVDGAVLPFPSAGVFHYNKRVGYDLVVSEYDETAVAVPLEELQRTLLPGGFVVVDRRNLSDAGHPDNLVETRELSLGGALFTVFEKK
jgi:acetyltransferase-like isoleucine patch superfamily enzyme